ncbi:MAG: FAD-dependent oxidoreductase [Acidobacteriaceae bacterium]|nr:FAD-dependent oxidoreductase [Acidobacteriaceae bacterium]
MSKPILLAIDDDASVLEAVVEDLRRHYGRDYRILRASSGSAALDVCRQLKERKDTVALFLSDQRMPGMSGVELLEQTIQSYPEAKRVLLTAYADTDAAIRAINSAKIHYYLNKPWDPPEERLYPVLDDLLETWKKGYKPPFEGIRVVGTRWSPADHAVRDFLARNRIPYQWLDPENHPEALLFLKEKGIDDTRLPVVVLDDGTALIQPGSSELAARLGMPTQAQQRFYDLVIVGAGPAGLAAGVYAASEGLSTLIVECNAIGGQAGASSKIENYLGFPQGLSGAELADRAYIQAQRLGAEFLTQRAASLCSDSQYRVVRMADGQEIACHVCLICTGVSYRRFEVPGAEQFTGAGVYYGATTAEAAACTDEVVYIVGGANSAGQAAMHFARHARAVHMLIRADSLAKSMSKYLIDQIAATPNIAVETCTEITSMSGNSHLETVTLETLKGVETRPATSVYIFIGAVPKTGWLPGEIARDSDGFILTGPDLKLHTGAWKLDREPYLLETSMPGVFVAGDVRHNSVKRCASAVGEGAIAIQFVHQYLATL